MSEAEVIENGGSDNGESAAWLSSVPENLRDNDAFKGIESASDVYQQFVDLKGSAENMVTIPGQDASDEDRAAFFNRIGRPESAEKYTITKPENLPEDIPYDDATADHFKGVFHQIGLSNDQAGKIWNEYHEMVVKAHEMESNAEREATDAALNSLKDEWTGDKYKENTELAHRAFTQLFENEDQAKEAKAFLEDSKVGGVSLGNHPMFLKIFHQLASSIADDRLNTGRGDGINGESSEEERAKKRFPNTKF